MLGAAVLGFLYSHLLQSEHCAEQQLHTLAMQNLGIVCQQTLQTSKGKAENITASVIARHPTWQTASQQP